MNSVRSNNLSLKYQKFPPSGCKEIEILCSVLGVSGSGVIISLAKGLFYKPVESHGEIKSNSPIMLCYIMIYDVWVSQKSKNRRKKSGLQRPQQVNHITQQPDQIFFLNSRSRILSLFKCVQILLQIFA